MLLRNKSKYVLTVYCDGGLFYYYKIGAKTGGEATLITSERQIPLKSASARVAKWGHQSTGQ